MEYLSGAIAARVEPPRPFLKWAGGKGRLLPDLISRAPSSFERYFEPFMGGAALFFALQPENSELSDVNRELVNAFQVVKDDPNSLIQELSRHLNNRRYFYKIRKLDRRTDFWTYSPVERAARFIYLNKTCFNGLCRVNSEGQFNVPYGMYKNPKIVDEENLLACSAALASTKIIERPYEAILDHAKAGDFVYFDPPYIPLTETASFTSYASDGFTLSDQQRLAEFCGELNQKGVLFMLTNSDTPLAEELYRSFFVEKINSPRSVSADGTKRKAVKDIVVRNYP